MRSFSAIQGRYISLNKIVMLLLNTSRGVYFSDKRGANKRVRGAERYRAGHVSGQLGGI